MRRIFLILIAALFILGIAPGAMAASKTLTFVWNQAAADTASPGFGGWRIYSANAPGGPYTLAVTVPYSSSNPANEYQASQSFTVPDNSSGTYYFVATAFDTAGNESARSNEASVLIDFAPPGVPIQLRVTISTGN